MGKMKCTAAGDAMMFRRIPGEYEGYRELREFILKGDFRFMNLETTVHRFETFGNALSGGSWFCAEPEILEDIRAMGFNILTTANNHALDYGYKGLELTLDYIRKAGFPVAGTGMTLADASGPVYLDTLQGRYALIAGCSTMSPDMMAGEQTRLMIGRPGVNGIRYNTTFTLPTDDFNTMKRIADEIGINGSSDITRAEGYLPPIPEGKMVFGSEVTIQEGEKPGKITHVNPKDMKRMEKAIEEARFFADFVIVSMHSHEIKYKKKEEPAQFFEEFCRACIDAGADAVIGTGPHLLRPIEIYKGKPIFYCLGDFFLENETMKKVPSGMFEKQGLTGNENMKDMYEDRSGGGKRGLYYSQVMYESYVPYWEMENGELTKLIVMPTELHFGQPRSTGGMPSPKYDANIIERLAEMSKPYGTEITIDRHGYGVVKL